MHSTQRTRSQTTEHHGHPSWKHQPIDGSDKCRSQQYSKQIYLYLINDDNIGGLENKLFLNKKKLIICLQA